MTNSSRKTSDLVKQEIEEDAVIRHGLERGIINVRALARQIQVTTGTEATLDSIVSAIWRYPIQESAVKSQTIGKLIAKLSLRDEIFAIGVLNSEEIWLSLARLPGEINVSRGDTLNIISGVEATTVVIDTKNADKLYAMLPKKSIGRVFDDLAQITVHLKEPSWEGLGVISALSTELALNDVPILFHFGYGPPPSIVFEVHEKDAVRAYQALERLRRPSKLPRDIQGTR